MAILNPPAVPLMPLRKIYAMLVIWGLMVIVAALLPIKFSIKEIENKHLLNAIQYAHEVEHNMVISEVTLDGFRALYGKMPNIAVDNLHTYVTKVQEAYPQFLSFEIYEKISSDQMVALQKLMQKNGYENYQIKSFGFESNRNWMPARKKEIYYPIVFISPLTPEKYEVLGLDVDDISYFRNAIEETLATGRAAVTKPFELIQGGKAYAILKELDSHPTRIAGEIVLVDQLPRMGSTKLMNGLNVALYYSQNENGSDDEIIRIEKGEDKSNIERQLFPKMSYEHHFSNVNRPLKLKIDYQAGWSDLNLLQLFFYLALAMMSTYIFFRYLITSRKNSLQLANYQQHLMHVSGHDSLTGLVNRPLLFDRLEQAIELSKRSGQHGALIFLDLNNFKSVNDTHGHLVGDELLKSVAQRLESAVRKVDTVARLGGDEFVIVIRELGQDQSAAQLAAQEIVAKIKDALTGQHYLGSINYQLSASFGLSLFNADQTSVNQLLSEADKKMYQEKRP